MSILLESYRTRVGEANTRRQGNGFNGPCPFCGGSDRRSDRFVVWPERSDNLGETCQQHSVSGVWYCRQCEKSGDTIAFLMESEGMTFKSSCAELGITTSLRKAPMRRTPQPPQAREAGLHLSEWPIKADDPVKWREYATKLHAESRQHIARNSAALKWLAARGLDTSAIEKYQLGYLQGDEGKTGRIRARSALGLAPKQGKDGREKKTIFIPRGIVIPHFDGAGRIIRLRIRRPKPDVQHWGQKYLVVEGSSSQPMLLPAAASPQLAAYMVVEAELDAMLIHHATGGIVGAFAALTNRGKPDPAQHQLLKEAARILVALDYDPREVTRPDGSVITETPGGIGWIWWDETYRSAKRWPTPSGKDPGDAFAEGVDIRSWVSAGLPAALSLPDAGPTDAFSTGMSNAGGGGTENAAPHEDHTRGNTLTVPEVRQEDSLPAAVLRLQAIWRQVPGFTVAKKEDGSLSFNWNKTWARACDENWRLLGDLQNTVLRDEECWQWITACNPHEIVSYDNLLHIRD